MRASFREPNDPTSDPDAPMSVNYSRAGRSLIWSQNQATPSQIAKYKQQAAQNQQAQNNAVRARGAR